MGRAMLRLALTPRWLVVAVVLLALIVAAFFLGRWQWDRTQAILAAERAAIAAPIDVLSVLAEPVTDPLPNEAIGRPVTLSGTYEADRQVLVANRALGDAPGAWVVTGMRTDDGALIPVLRGWVVGPDDPGVGVPEGELLVRGVLQPDEVFYSDAVPVDGQIVSISQNALAQVWGEDVPPGFVVLQSQTPEAPPAPTPVPPTIDVADVPFPLQNFFYAFQWWIFAAFGLFLYLRWLRIEARKEIQSIELGQTIP